MPKLVLFPSSMMMFSRVSAPQLLMHTVALLLFDDNKIDTNAKVA